MNDSAAEDRSLSEFPTEEQRLVLLVSSSWGSICSREYVNQLQVIFGQPELTEERYAEGIRECDRLGRDGVKALHRDALDRLIMRGFVPVTSLDVPRGGDSPARLAAPDPGPAAEPPADAETADDPRAV